MGGLPEPLTLPRHRDPSPRWELGARWTVMTVLSGLAVAALFNLFGQNPKNSHVVAERATLDVSAPARLRGGLFFQGRFRIEAHEALANATLVLEPGWLESMHINTIEPAPVEEASRDGSLTLSYGPLAAGELLSVHLQFQVNPTNLGRRPADVAVYDGEALVARADRTVTVFP